MIEKARGAYLVEGDPEVLALWEDIVARVPDLCVCGSAATAAQALHEMPELDAAALVIVDIALRRTHHGLFLIHRLRQARPHLPIIALHDDPALAGAALDQGASAFLPQAQTRDGLRSLLQTLLPAR